MAEQKTKNLIFDLGGVILDLSVEHTLQAFAALSGWDKTRIEELFHTLPEFNLYEKGMIEDVAFRDFVRETLHVNVTDEHIDSAWNAMLRGIPNAKLELLLKLQQHQQVYLLSNTNNIHLHYVNSKMLPSVTGEISLDRYFHRAYYSHIMKKRKPDAEIFEQVLEENNLKAGDTLFLDDNAANIEGAKALGIKTFHVTSPDLVLAYFHE
ncbi:MAG: HAD family phosphatase [Cyclobacteriaceae bacterium]|nr:HAD family phosphatase [Cyclobacteriaceae bacterium]